MEIIEVCLYWNYPFVSTFLSLRCRISIEFFCYYWNCPFSKSYALCRKPFQKNRTRKANQTSKTLSNPKTQDKTFMIFPVFLERILYPHFLSQSLNCTDFALFYERSQSYRSFTQSFHYSSYSYHYDLRILKPFALLLAPTIFLASA